MSRVIKVKDVQIGRGRTKICCSVMGSSEQAVLEQVELSNNAVCDVIEFRVDHFDEVTDIAKVKSVLRKMRRCAVKPIIFTLRRLEEGGKVHVETSYYKELLTMVSMSGLVDIVDVEESAVPGDKAFIESLKDNGAYVIISKHDFGRTPSQQEILDTYIRMEAMGADVAKVAFMPSSKKDVLALICATEEFTSDPSNCPAIAISMGKLGMITRVIGGFMESALTFASLCQASAPGQISAANMKVLLDTLHNNYKKVVLVGISGSGKTSVANSLYNTYGLNKIDLNAYIEEKEKTAVSELAEQDMELLLDKEAKYLRKVMDKDIQVISAGNGLALRKESVELIKDNCIIVFLKASEETVAQRMRKDPNRESFYDIIDQELIKKLNGDVCSTYEDIADVKIATDNKNIDQISKEIVETLGFTM